MDLMDALREAGKKKDYISTKIVWKVVDKDDKLLVVLPNLHQYRNIENEQILKSFRETIHEVIQGKPSYVVLYIEDLVYTNDQTLRDIETVYGIELQWLRNIKHLENPLFMEHHHPRKLYVLYEKLYDCEITGKYFNKAIVDTIGDISYIRKLLKDKGIPIHHGISYLEEIVNIRVYLNKLVSRISTPFRPSSTSQDDYDIAFVVGNLEQAEYFDILTQIKQSLKQQQCGMVYSCNRQLSKILPDLKAQYSAKIPMVDYEESILDTDVVHELVGRIERLPKTYTTFVFLGSFSFDSKESRDIWNRHIKYLENVSIFDPYAYDSLLKNVSNESLPYYRISKEPDTMIRLFLKGEIEEEKTKVVSRGDSETEEDEGDDDEEDEGEDDEEDEGDDDEEDEGDDDEDDDEGDGGCGGGCSCEDSF